MDTNLLYYGDNLDILRKHIDDKSVDLIYIDPPFNSKQAYNIIFSEPNGTSSQAQIRAFEDTWHWTKQTEDTYFEIIDTAPPKVVECIRSFRSFLDETDMMAYLTMMTPRLIELHRVLKPTGNFYLHCDPTASHYLKIVLDQVFGIRNFRNEIIWHYRRWTNTQNQFQSMHDVILFYTKSKENVFNLVEVEMSESQKKKFARGWDSNVIHTKEDKYSQLIVYNKSKLEQTVAEGKMDLNKLKKIVYRDKPKVASPDVITLPVLNSQSKERLGYPTQKPEALLERIIKASSNEGDVVLDSFCGCGSAIAVAERLKRKWIGIDITHLAIALVKNRLEDSFDNVDYTVIGEPTDMTSARALAMQDRYQFQWWALSLIKARPAKGKKRGADKGVDGVIYFQDVDPDKPKKKITRKIVVQVKSGNVSVKDIRELRTVVENQKAIIGVFITLNNPTKPMITEAVMAGYYERWTQKYPKIQIRTIKELLQGKGIEIPRTPIDITFRKAEKVKTIQETQFSMKFYNTTTAFQIL